MKTMTLAFTHMSWLGALSLQGFGWLMGPEMAARLPFIALLILTLGATWWGAYYLARTPGAQQASGCSGQSLRISNSVSTPLGSCRR